MPRVQDGAFGASERFAVSPGHEAEGYLQMPGGQSGHPLSPYYRAGFDEWAEGQAAAVPAGAAEHTLTLTPGAARRCLRRHDDRHVSPAPNATSPPKI